MRQLLGTERQMAAHMLTFLKVQEQAGGLGAAPRLHTLSAWAGSARGSRAGAAPRLCARLSPQPRTAMWVLQVGRALFTRSFWSTSCTTSPGYSWWVLDGPA